MYTRHDVLEASHAGQLLETIAATPNQNLDSAGRMLADLHNRGEIDFLASWEPASLAAVSGHHFFPLQRIFCHALPHIDCSAEAAARACQNMFARAGNDGAAGQVYVSLSAWFGQSPVHADEGLALILHDPETHRRLVRPLFIAGANHDARKYFEEAFSFSNDSDSPIRLDALWALGQIASAEDETLLTRTIDYFDKVIDAPVSDGDTAVVVEAALNLLHRSGSSVAHAVEPLLQEACRKPTPETRYALANGLLLHRRHYTEAMVDTTFSALQHTTKHDIHTSNAIDSILYQWDLDADRQRVLRFLVGLFSQGNDALDLDLLANFSHQLRNQPGDVLGWYIVSLLLTGEHALCEAAERLLPYQQTREGLDIDLGPFSLTPPWILYLARKTLGYCPLHKESAAALLLSCLRIVPDQDRTELEDLVLDHFLMNYLTAIDWFESALADSDPARDSVDRLSSSLREYVAGLERYGTCPAFRPSERERLLQGYRQTDFQREVHKKAEQRSLLSALAHKATILYGTASIFNIRRDDASEPQRQEVSMRRYEHFFEFPRLDSIDPVGLQYNIRRFRSEPPPS